MVGGSVRRPSEVVYRVQSDRACSEPVRSTSKEFKQEASTRNCSLHVKSHGPMVKMVTNSVPRRARVARDVLEPMSSILLPLSDLTKSDLDSGSFV